MINSLQGTIAVINERKLTLNVGPVGFLIEVPQAHRLTPQATISLHTYLHWHPEQGMQLFGFQDPFQKELFLIMIECSGIGPKLALTILDQLEPASLVRAVQTADQKTLACVSGVGPKKAEHLIVQLRHKIERLLIKNPVIEGGDNHLKDWHAIGQVLESLQYSKMEISAALNHLKTLPDVTVPFDTLLRKALNFLAK